jgi:hypothetical protein
MFSAMRAISARRCAMTPLAATPLMLLPALALILLIVAVRI